jgi:hypothetical protein
MKENRKKNKILSNEEYHVFLNYSVKKINYEKYISNIYKFNIIVFL